MRWIDVRQLKNLRRFPVPPEVLAAGRVKLIAVIEAAPMIHRSSAWFASAVWRPVMASMIVIVTVTGGGTFVAAHDALPGDRLYVVKLAGEEFHERMTLTSEQRFVVQAAHATRRLKETERLLELQGLAGEKRAMLVGKALHRYEDNLFVMNEIAVKFEPDPKKPKKGKRALKAIEGMFDQHAHLMESATRAEPVLASLMLEPSDATLSLEADLTSSIPTDDGGTHEDEGNHQPSWVERTRESQRRIREELEASRRDEDAEPAKDDDRQDEDGDDRGKRKIDVDSRLDFRLEKPLEIKVGM